MDRDKLKWVLNSRAYSKARRMVAETIRSPDKLRALIVAAQSKLFSNSNKKIGEVTTSLAATIRLIKAYASGQYRDISFESLALIVASIIYFVMPVDVFPDFIVGMGLVDDAALLGWTFKSVASDIENFIAWERGQQSLKK